MDDGRTSPMTGMTRRGFLRAAGLAGAAVALGALAGCAGTADAGASGDDGGTKVVVLAGESQYGDVAEQVGGAHVEVTSVISDPAADPHDFEATPSDAKLLVSASVVIENGLGYDGWLDDMLSSNENPDRTVISAQQVLGLPDDTQNPHLWYDPKTMPAVAEALAAELERVDPDHADDYRQNLSAFEGSADQYASALEAFRQQHPGVSVAATEPVANYLLDAAGVEVKTPWSLQAAIMNDQDPSAQDMATQSDLLSGGNVDAFVYNEQVSSALTQKWLDAADASGVPVVAVYETMPPNHHYVDWMTAELDALTTAVSQKQSTTSLS